MVEGRGSTVAWLAGSTAGPRVAWLAGSRVDGRRSRPLGGALLQRPLGGALLQLAGACVQWVERKLGVGFGPHASFGDMVILMWQAPGARSGMGHACIWRSPETLSCGAHFDKLPNRNQTFETQPPRDIGAEIVTPSLRHRPKTNFEGVQNRCRKHRFGDLARLS